MKVTAFLPGVCGLALVLLLLLPFNAAGVESRGPLGGYHWYTMFMFGDSFADTGNLPRTNSRSSLSRQWHYPYGTFNGSRSGNPLGRFSNYLVQPDIIARMLGRLVGPPAYKRTVKHYCDPSGMSFAVGGSGVFEVPENLTTLSQQIDNFERLIKDRTISKWHLADSVALVAISGNDYAHGTNSSDVANMIAIIKKVTTEITANVQRLQKLGVKKILVNQLHPVGCTPWLTRPSNYTVCNSRANMGVDLHNGHLSINLRKTKNVHILDLATAFANIVNPAPGEGSRQAKRFEHKLTPCCESFDPEGYCGQLSKNSKRLYTVCKNPDQYFYWDSVHPTQAGWEAVMKQLQKPMLKFLTKGH
ncbi:hypothetical protein ZWY2020_006160 [Hordeum vulgare]|nr:hypothetical protein ZWY2020_006160 [Hordeum vulgare]